MQFLRSLSDMHSVRRSYCWSTLYLPKILLNRMDVWHGNKFKRHLSSKSIGNSCISLAVGPAHSSGWICSTRSPNVYNDCAGPPASRGPWAAWKSFPRLSVSPFQTPSSIRLMRWRRESACEVVRNSCFHLRQGRPWRRRRRRPTRSSWLAWWPCQSGRISTQRRSHCQRRHRQFCTGKRICRLSESAW